MAQKRVESNNFAIRKSVLQYDDVMNTQREVIYSQRNQVLDGVDMDATLRKMIGESISDDVHFYCAGSNPADWNIAGLETKYRWLNDVVMVAVREREELREYGSPFESTYGKKYISAVEQVLDLHRTFYFILARVDFHDTGSLTTEYLHDRCPVSLRFHKYGNLSPPLSHLPYALAY